MKVLWMRWVKQFIFNIQSPLVFSAWIIGRNDFAVSEAPPTSPPSTFLISNISAALSLLSDPPYIILISWPTDFPYISHNRERIKL